MRNTPEVNLFMALIKEAIRVKRLTQPLAYSNGNIARRTKITQGAISMILSGKRGPSFYTAVRLANLLAIDLGELQRGFREGR